MAQWACTLKLRKPVTYVDITFLPNLMELKIRIKATREPKRVKKEEIGGSEHSPSLSGRGRIK